MSIPTGMASASFSLTIMDDSFVEGVEQISLEISQGDVVGIDRDAVEYEGKETIVYIIDDDGIYIHKICSEMS